MKKENTKLNLNKRTISNLSNSEMSKQMGGLKTNAPTHDQNSARFTKRCHPSW